MATVGTKRTFTAMNHSTDAEALSRNRTPDRNESRFATSAPPTPLQPQENLTKNFDRDASIVLLGARGTGKSTLGVFASTALQRRLIETDHSFQEITGQSSATYRRSHGAPEYHRRYLEVLKTLFDKCGNGCVIVCGASSLDHNGQALMQQFAQEHPVIHVLRDTTSVQEYLGIKEDGKVSKLLDISDAIFRVCSNFDYFNYPERSAIGKDARSQSPSQLWTPYLALKNAERHFLKFLARATRAKDIPSLEDAFPLSQVNAEDRTFTYAVSIPLPAVMDPSLDIEAVEEGADAIELVVEMASKEAESHPSSLTSRRNETSQAIARMRRSIVIPVIYHVQPPTNKDGLSNGGKETDDYVESVYYGLRLAPDYATVSLSLDDDIIRHILKAKGSTKMIADYYSEREQLGNWNHEVWTAAYERARWLGFDVVRLSWPATRIEDNFQVHVFRSKLAALGHPPIPVVALNSGLVGRTSACFNPTLTPVTHSAVSSLDKRPDKPYITVSEATKSLYHSFIQEPMHFYILGAATSYSLSPVMHNAAYRVYGMPHSYQFHQTSNLKDLHDLVSDLHFGGCSVSLPFKVEVIALTHSLSKHAKAIGAVNTLVPVRRLLGDGSVPSELELFNERNQSGPVKAIYGENTDWQGIRACIRRGLSPANAVGPRTTALLIGAGGMARAAVYAMLKLGIQNIVVFNRTFENAVKLVAHFERLVHQTQSNSISTFATKRLKMHVLESRDDPWPENLRQPTIVVSCIPTHRIGDNPSPDFTLPPQWFKSLTGGVVLELAYRNLHTPLLEQTRAEAPRGWVTMDGLDLLPEQAFAQFELFTGRRAPRRLMTLEVLRNYRDENGQPDPNVIQWRIDQITEQMP